MPCQAPIFGVVVANVNVVAVWILHTSIHNFSIKKYIYGLCTFFSFRFTFFLSPFLSSFIFFLFILFLSFSFFLFLFFLFIILSFFPYFFFLSLFPSLLFLSSFLISISLSIFLFVFLYFFFFSQSVCAIVHLMI